MVTSFTSYLTSTSPKSGMKKRLKQNLHNKVDY